MYVIVRTDDGKFVARPGSEKSYTRKLQNARTFRTREAAELDRCLGNEVIRSIEEVIGGST
jgi:hypothetical protein